MMWYLSIKPLPEIIAKHPKDERDIVTCAANTVLVTRPSYSLMPPPKEEDFQYTELMYLGFEATSMYC